MIINTSIVSNAEAGAQCQICLFLLLCFLGPFSIQKKGKRKNRSRAIDAVRYADRLRLGPASRSASVPDCSIRFAPGSPGVLTSDRDGSRGIFGDMLGFYAPVQLDSRMLGSGTMAARPRPRPRPRPRLFYGCSYMYHLSGNNRRNSHFMGS